MSKLITPRGGELLDVVDIYGGPTGEVLSKQIIHDQGIRHRDVHVWITNGTHLLQQRRALDKAVMPGDWDISVAGHVAAGESFADTALRETQEELGRTVSIGHLIRIGIIPTQMLLPGWKAVHNTVGDNFVVVERGLTLDDLTLQEEEVIDARWYPIDQLEHDLLHPDTAKRHAPQPFTLYALGIAGMRGAAAAMSQR